MVVFEDIEDVKEWLRPMDYVTLWRATEPYAVFSEADRDHCDGLIAAGTVASELILRVLKSIACDTIRDKLGLKYRTYRHLSGDAGGALH